MNLKTGVAYDFTFNGNRFIDPEDENMTMTVRYVYFRTSTDTWVTMSTAYTSTMNFIYTRGSNDKFRFYGTFSGLIPSPDID